MKKPLSSIGQTKPDVNVTKLSLNATEAAQSIGVSTRTLYRLMNEGLFPKPRKIGSRSLWDRSEVLNYWEGRAAA